MRLKHEEYIKGNNPFVRGVTVQSQLFDELNQRKIPKIKPTSICPSV